MASNLKYSTAAKNAKLGATGLRAYIGASAKLRLYDGAQPASPDTAISTQNMLCELVCNAAAFGSEAGGVLTAGAISAGAGTAAAGTGKTAIWYRLWKNDGTTPVVDGTVGQSGGGTFDMALDNPSIAQNQAVSVSSYTITEGN